MAQKWHFDIWGDLPRTEISKKLHPAFFNFWRRGTVSEISAKKRNFGSERGHKTIRETINWASRILFFLHVGKGSQGHVLDRSGPIWPTWNTPKKGFLSRKTPKNGVKMGWGHFHERVNRSPIRCGHFGANGSKISCFVSEIRPFKKKSAGINKSVMVHIGFCWRATLGQFSYGLFNGA